MTAIRRIGESLDRIAYHLGVEASRTSDVRKSGMQEFDLSTRAEPDARLPALRVSQTVAEKRELSCE